MINCYFYNTVPAQNNNDAVRYRLENIEQFERACLHFSPDNAAYDA
jgi:hypothetical protein